MNPKKIVLLGSTGSIGRSTLEVVDRHPGAFEIIALAAHANTKLLAEQYRKYRPTFLCLGAPDRAEQLKQQLKGESVEILSGNEGLLSLAALEQVDIVVNAVVGAAGLTVSIETLKNGKSLALANKESLVAGGPLFQPLVKKHKGRILPIDSEHSAIWQALNCGRPTEIKRLIITASGGPFRQLPAEEFPKITLKQALNHPTWSMGDKITIDSATLVNKGLEVIEAVNLFEIPIDKVDVVIHPQSIVHSMVEFIDSSIIAQLSSPDMRLPISYALFWPQRVESEFGQMDLSRLTSLTFEPPDTAKFPALKLAYEVAHTGGTAPAVFNAANEVAVNAFLKEMITFDRITDIIASVVENINVVSEPSLNDILAADTSARKLAGKEIEKAKC